ncbi:hypothetical protein [Sulfitobacter aestuariivivens]|uniref:DUF2147 domain-containing protein n=1 Tax=Sulfitobacter aestuariivivens TaxID=2766981 RepID=A0A927D2H5_9RHOB|nr:hypothetical protein [Sulfitobacter aestuariivivens]MBD3663799.1 hypothetical protein [Sulfitobacter aestuariivivens]
MSLIYSLFVLIFLGAFAGPALAQSDDQTEIPLGLWETKPDRSGIVFHIRTKRCGRALCGRVERVKDRRGFDTPSNAVSSEVLLGLRPRPDGSFVGEVRGTEGQRYPEAWVTLQGNLLVVRACEAADCAKATWKRLR